MLLLVLCHCEFYVIASFMLLLVLCHCERPKGAKQSHITIRSHIIVRNRIIIGCHCGRPKGAKQSHITIRSHIIVRNRIIIGCHCERPKGAKQSHNSLDKSSQEGLILAIKSIFFCLEPAFICFSLAIALSISSKTS